MSKKDTVDHFHDVIVSFTEDQTKTTSNGAAAAGEFNFAKLGPKWIAHSGQDTLMSEIQALKVASTQQQQSNKQNVTKLTQEGGGNANTSRVISCKFDESNPSKPRAEMLIFGTVKQAIRWAELMSDFIHTESKERFRTTGNKVWPRSEEEVRAEEKKEKQRAKEEEKRRQWEIDQANLSVYWWYNVAGTSAAYKGVNTEGEVREVTPKEKDGGCCIIM